MSEFLETMAEELARSLPAAIGRERARVVLERALELIPEEEPEADDKLLAMPPAS